MSKNMKNRKLITFLASAAVASVFLSNGENVKASTELSAVDRSQNQQVDLIEGMIEQQKQEIDRLKDESEANQKLISTNQALLDEEKENLDKVGQKCNDILSMKNAVQDTLDTLDGQKDSEQQSLKKMQKDLERIQNEAALNDTERNAIIQDIEESKEKIDLIEDNLQVKKDMLMTLENVLAAMKMNDKVIVQEDRESRIALANIESANHYLASYREAIENSTKLIAELEAQIADINKEIENSSDDSSKIALNQELDQLQYKLKKNVENIETRKKQIEKANLDLDKNIKRFENAINKIPRIKAHFDQEKEISLKIATLAEQNTDLEEKLVQSQAKKEEIEQKLTKLEAETIEQKQQVLELMQKIQRSQENLNEIADVKAKYLDEETECNSQLEDLIKEKLKSKDKILLLEEKLTNLSEKQKELNFEIINEEKKLEQYESLAKLLEENKIETVDDSSQTEESSTEDTDSQTDIPTLVDDGTQTEEESTLDSSSQIDDSTSVDDSTQTDNETKDQSSQTNDKNNIDQSTQTDEMIEIGEDSQLDQEIGKIDQTSEININNGFIQEQSDNDTSILSDQIDKEKNETDNNTKTKEKHVSVVDKTKNHKKTIKIIIKNGKMLTKISGRWKKITSKQLKKFIKSSKIKVSGTVTHKNVKSTLYLKNGQKAKKVLTKKKVKIYGFKIIGGRLMAKISLKQLWIPIDKLLF